MRQVFAWIDRVACPSDVSEIVFASFVDGEVHIDVVFVVFGHAVVGDGGIAIAYFVVFGYEQCFVVFKFRCDEFFAAEECEQVLRPVGFLHREVYLVERQCVVAFDIDFVYAYFVFFVHINVEQHRAGLCGVGFLVYHNGGVVVAFACHLFLYGYFGAVEQVGCYLVAACESGFGYHVLFFRFFQAVVVHARYAWTLF